MDRELLSLLLPEAVLDYFNVVKVEKSSESITIHLKEDNVVPQEYKQHKLTSKGFYAPVLIKDFPLRGKACFLRVQRRRWLNEDTGQVVSRDWNTVAKGTRMTVEFASFLKGIAGQ